MFETLTPTQVARKLKMTVRQVRRLIVVGPLLGHRLNGRLYVLKADLEQFIRRSAA